MFIAAAAVMAAGCGNTSSKQAVQDAPAEIIPSVAVEQVFVQDVPQEATYTSTVQAYVKNMDYGDIKNEKIHKNIVGCQRRICNCGITIQRFEEKHEAAF